MIQKSKILSYLNVLLSNVFIATDIKHFKILSL